MKQKADNQFFTPHNVLEEAKFLKMTLAAQMLFIHLCKLKNRLKSNCFYRSIQTLMRDTGMGESTIRRAKKSLIINQYINVERDFFTHSGNRSADRFSLNGYKYRDNA